MDIKTAIAKTQEAIAAVQQLDRSREASIAITQLETGLLWLRQLDQGTADSAE